MVETDFTSIIQTVRYWLGQQEDLWLHENTDELRQRVEESLGHRTPAESVPRCRRKIWEQGELMIQDNDIKQRFMEVRGRREKEYRKTFGKDVKITRREDGRQEILMTSDML